MTLFIVKPDAVRRDLIGLILNRIEAARFRILELKMIVASDSQVRNHYIEHIGKDFYEKLFLTMACKNIVVGLADYRPDCLQSVIAMRTIVGQYQDPRTPGTIRGDFAINCTENSIHASDSMEAVARESKVWFS